MSGVDVPRAPPSRAAGSTEAPTLTPTTLLSDAASSIKIPDAVLESILQALGVPVELLAEVTLADLVGLSVEELEGVFSSIHPVFWRGRLRAMLSKLRIEASCGSVDAQARPQEQTQARVNESAPESGWLKFADWLDQSDGGTFPLLSAPTLADLRARHRRVLGGDPDDADRPTDEQLSALHAKLAAGATPYADFALFGRWGSRTAKLRAQQGFAFLGDGLWVKKTLPQVATHDAWTKSWGVFRAAMVMLGAATPVTLSRYAAGIQRLHAHHGQWPTLAIADEKCRDERWGRLLSDHLAGLITIPSFEEASPWESVIAFSTWTPAGGGLGDFWFDVYIAPVSFHMASPQRAAARSAPSGTTRADGDTAACAEQSNTAQASEDAEAEGPARRKRRRKKGAGRFVRNP